jgi:hypothetical protein
MRVKLFGSLILAICSTAVVGQNSNEQEMDRVIHLTSIEKPRDIQEIATVIRSIGEIKSLSADASARSLSVHGTAEQIALAESLAHELTAGQGSNGYEYRMSTGDLVHVYYLPHTETVRDFASAATLIRSIADMRWAFTYTTPRAFVVRGKPGQLEMTEWLVQQLDQPADGPSGSREYRVKGAADDLVHVHFVKHVDSAENLQELVVLVRSVGNIRRLFSTSGQTMAVAMRGDAEQLGLADWLLQKLDLPTAGSAGEAQDQEASTREFQMPSSGDAVRVFYLRDATVQAFQNAASDVRSVAGVSKVFTYNALGALAVRGTADQIVAARNLINERFKNSQQ